MGIIFGQCCDLKQFHEHLEFLSCKFGVNNHVRMSQNIFIVVILKVGKITCKAGNKPQREQFSRILIIKLSEIYEEISENFSQISENNYINLLKYLKNFFRFMKFLKLFLNTFTVVTLKGSKIACGAHYKGAVFYKYSYEKKNSDNFEKISKKC